METDLETDNSRQTAWQSLCLTCDREASVYFSIFFVVLVVISFCFYQLIHLTECESQNTYVGILTLMLGVLLPQPRM